MSKEALTNQFDWDHLNSLLTDEDREELDLEAISLSMAGLMRHCGKNRNQMADILGVNRSRITAMLRSGKNLQVKSIYRFAKALGYDFDVTFRLPSQKPAPQPWADVIESPGLMTQCVAGFGISDGLINKHWNKPLSITTQAANNPFISAGTVTRHRRIDASIDCLSSAS